MSKSYAPSTLPNYYRKLSLFHSFLRAHNLPTSFPAAPRLVQLFIAYLHAAGHAPSSIRSHISALATVHKILDLPDPTSCFSTGRILKGVSKASSHTPQVRRPISSRDLSALLAHVPATSHCAFTRSLLYSMFTLAYHACLRAGELTVSSHSSHTLALEDLSFDTHSPRKKRAFAFGPTNTLLTKLPSS